MELFKLLGTISIDNADANRALDETADKGGKTHSKLSGFFGGIGRGALAAGKTIATGLAIGGAAMGTLTIKALDMSGELEQNMGGSNAVFGKYAGEMQDTAKYAFTSMGLSTSDYLATANKMGALFQGAGFSIEESMHLSSTAMQRAADVASIMGIDTSAAMEAITGAAKGNFTMMDNLGVAMNETTLAAFALEKGYAKTYAEMTQQERIGVAMAMFLDRTAYAAGNYAKENETLAGALGTAKAAMANFLSGAGDVDQLVTAFTNAANVIVKNLNELAPRLMDGVTQIIAQLVPVLPPLIQSLLPTLVSGAVSLINGLVAAMPAVLNGIMACLPALIDGITQIINAVIQALPQMMNMFVAALPTLIPMLINALVSMIVTLCASLPQIIQPIIDYLPQIIISIVNALMENLPALIQGAVQLVVGLVAALPQIIMALIQAMPTVISSMVKGLIAAAPALVQGFVDIWNSVNNALDAIINGIVQFVVGCWKSLLNFLSPVLDGIKTGITNAWNAIKTAVTTVMNAIKTVITTVWNAIKSAVTTVVNAIKTVITTVWNAIKSTITTVVNGIKTVITTVWNAIKSTITTVVNAIKSTVTTVWNAIKSAVTTAVNAIKSVITSVWNAIKSTVTSVVNAIKSVVTSVWNAIKSTITNVMNGIKTTISNVWNGIKTTVSNVVNGIKTTVSNVFTGIKTTATNIWNGIKTAIQTPIEKARDLVKGAIDKIKGFFSFKISWPKIPLPHFAISPSGWKFGDLLQGSIPKLGIEWYAKGGVMERPTLFDYDPVTGTARVGGEAGAEAIAPIDTLQQYIKAAVRNENNMVAQKLDRIISLLAQFFPEALTAMDQVMVLDTGVLVAQTAPRMNVELGKIVTKKGRGR